MKILYAGTPEIAVAPLNALVASQEVEVVGVLTREDAPVGRKRILSASAVAQRAEQLVCADRPRYCVPRGGCRRRCCLRGVTASRST